MATGTIKKPSDTPSWGTPISVALPFTATVDGIFHAGLKTATSGTGYLYVKRPNDTGAYAATYLFNGASGSLTFPVIAGETYEIYLSSNYAYATDPMIYPFA